MRFLVSIICLLSATILTAQFSGIDPQNFPTIRAYGGGSIFTNAKTADFTVTENGIPMTNGLTVECSTAVNDPSISVVLVIDISESMNERMSNGRTKLEWMKNGAKSFINSLVFNGTTQCAIITFNGQSYILSDFKTTARPLNEAIDSIEFGLGATNYEAPLIDPQKSAVALLKKTPTWIRRAVVFLTDGTPNQDPPVASIINQLNQLQATVYAIALSFDASPELREIADKTGGTTSIAFTEELLVNIYKDLGSKRPTTTYCWLSYTAPVGCTESSRNRNVQITYKPTNLRQTFTYVAPPSSVASLQVSQLVLPPFPDILPGQQATQQITITARNADITITGDGSTLPANFRVSDWGGSAPPFTLKSGQSRIITIRFTQTNPRDIRSGRLRINAVPCNSEYISLSGGAKKVVIVSPNGGEVLSSCDSILITWGGIDASDTVRLQYSTNNGNTWQLISNNATGLSHQWKAPMNGQYLFRIAARTTRSGGMANIHGYGTGTEIGYGISANEHASSFALIGQYERQLNVNGQQIASTRNQDMFLARMREANVLWLRTGVQFLTQYLPYTLATGKAVLMDKNDDMFTATDISRTVNSGRVSIILQKVTSTGNVEWSKELLGTQKSLAAQSFGKDSIGNYFLIGVYEGQLSLPMRVGGTTIINAIGQRPFTLLFNDRGDFLSLRDSIPKGYTRFPADTSRDSLGTLYTIRSFANTITLPDTSFRSSGKQDIAIRLTGRIFTPPDQSDSQSSVITPLLTLNQFKIDLPAITVGSSIDTIMTQYLCNKSDTPILLDEATISNGKGLTILEPKAGTLIPGDTCIAVAYRFIPQEKGQQQATVTFGNSCTSVSGIVNVEAISIGASISDQDWGLQRIFTNEQKLLQLRNTGDDDIRVTSIAIGTSNAFICPSLPSMPFTLKATSVLDIPCNFIPNDTITFTDSLLISIDKFSDPLIALLKGKGGIPSFHAKGYTFSDASVGLTSTEQADILVSNHSTTMPLSLTAVSIDSPEGDFFIIGSDPLPTQIDGSTKHTTKIGFKPMKAGTRTAYLKFTHDAMPGPEKKPITFDSVLIQGIGISKGLVIDTLLDIGSILTCDIAIKDIVITNPNDRDIRITDIAISDLPGNAFTKYFYTVKAPIIIPANGSAKIPIGFTPDSIGQKNALLTCTGEDGTIYRTFLIGSGERMPSSILINGNANGSIAYYPGEKTRFDISLSAQRRLPYPRIDSVLFTVNYPYSLLRMDSISSQLGNWNIQVVTHDNVNGKATILARSTTSLSEFPNSPLFSLHATSFLADVKNQIFSIQSSSNATCIEPSDASTTFMLSDVCFAHGRIISLMNEQFKIMFEDHVAEIHLPYNAVSEVSVIDINGKTTNIMPSKYVNAGVYRFTLPTTTPGVYVLIVRNGMHVLHKKFLIHDSSILY
ncbi:MAG: vWA domain-containing protein [Ignavibacteria bacterium]